MKCALLIQSAICERCALQIIDNLLTAFRTNVISDGGLLAGGNRALIRLRIPQISYGYEQEMLYDRRNPRHGVEYDPRIHGLYPPQGTVRVFNCPHTNKDIILNRIKWAIVRVRNPSEVRMLD